MRIAIIGAPHTGKHQLKDTIQKHHPDTQYVRCDNTSTITLQDPQHILGQIHTRYGEHLMTPAIKKHQLYVETPIEALGVYVSRHGTAPQHANNTVRASIASYDAILYQQPYNTLPKKEEAYMSITDRLKINDIIGNTPLDLTDNKILVVLEKQNHKKILDNLQHSPSLRQWLHKWNRNTNQTRTESPR